MADIRIEFHPGAAEDAAGAERWYAERSLIAARAFVTEFTVCVEALVEFPERSPGYLSGTRRFVFPKFPFSLIYRVRGGVITVIAVAHHRRKPGYWLARH